MVDDPPERLSKEFWERSSAEIREMAESGLVQSRFHDSLLSLWEMVGNFIFVPANPWAIHKGLTDEKLIEVSYLSEFPPVSLNVLDAYATSVLAADVFIPGGKQIVFSVSLDRGEAVLPSVRGASDLWISLSAFSGEEPCIATSECYVALLRFFSATVATKELQAGGYVRPWRPDLIFMTNLTGCVIRLPYPGRMLAVKTPYLVQHPVEQWPRATLRLPAAAELRRRARTVVDFLFNDPPASAGEA